MENLYFYFSIIVLILAIIAMWINLNKKIRHHEMLCLEDRQKLSVLESKLEEISCNVPMCHKREPVDHKLIYRGVNDGQELHN